MRPAPFSQSVLERDIRWLLRSVVLTALATATGCVTGGDGGGSTPQTVDTAESADGSSPQATTKDGGSDGAAGGGDAEAAEAAPPEVPPGERLELGPIENDDLKHAIYEAMEARLAHGDATSNGTEAATEIGDFEAFKFTIVKLTRGRDDVSGDPTTPPDGMDVEVTGWLRRTMAAEGSGGDEKSECLSFDAQIVMTHAQGDRTWTMAKDKDVAFGRQDQEDCY